MRRLSLFVLALFLLVAAACGDDGDSGDGDVNAQPAPGVSTFAEGGFDEIPRHPTSEELSPRNEQRGVVSQSYVVRNTTAERVLDFYRDAFTDLSVLSDPQSIGVNTWRGIWRMPDGDVLIVSATAEPGADTEQPGAPGDHDVQYSLSLGPADQQLEGIEL